MQTITYTFRGRVERGNGQPGYDWRDGYSETTAEGKVSFPWMTRGECQKDAKARGCTAKFAEYQHGQGRNNRRES